MEQHLLKRRADTVFDYRKTRRYRRSCRRLQQRLAHSCPCVARRLTRSVQTVDASDFAIFVTGIVAKVVHRQPAAAQVTPESQVRARARRGGHRDMELVRVH